MNTSPRTSSDDQYFRSIREVARHLGVSVKTVRRWIQGGELTGHKFGRQWRIKPSDLEIFTKMRRQA
jgi:excisionase family DNA binding protein